jgi:hypothetical protein
MKKMDVMSGGGGGGGGGGLNNALPCFEEFMNYYVCSLVMCVRY